MAAEHPFGRVGATAKRPAGRGVAEALRRCRPPVALRPGRWWSLPGGAGCTCLIAMEQTWKAIRAGLERALKRATAAAAAATADGEAAANAVAPPPLAGAELLPGVGHKRRPVTPAVARVARQGRRSAVAGGAALALCGPRSPTTQPKTHLPSMGQVGPTLTVIIRCDERHSATRLIRRMSVPDGHAVGKQCVVVCTCTALSRSK